MSKRKTKKERDAEMRVEYFHDKMEELAGLKTELKEMKEKADETQALLIQHYSDLIIKKYPTTFGTLTYIESVEYEVSDNQRLLDSGFSMKKFIEKAKIGIGKVKETVDEDTYKKLLFLNVITKKEEKKFFKLLK